MRQTAVLLLAMSLLIGCAMGNSDTLASVCPPVIEYPRAFQQKAAGELAQLPPGSAIEQMLDDYYVMREQSKACKPRGWRGWSIW